VGEGLKGGTLGDSGNTKGDIMLLFGIGKVGGESACKRKVAIKSFLL
jgi:hypothetical protein